MGEESIDNPNGAEYSSKSDFSKAEVTRLQVVLCNKIRSKEMREGYFNYDVKGNKIYITDARKEWIASVKSLRHLLQPEIKRSKTFAGREKEILEELETALETWGVYPMYIENGEIKINTEKKKFIPRIDQGFPTQQRVTQTYGTSTTSFTTSYGMYNDCFHGYWDELVEIYDKLFAELNILIDSCNYFKQKVAY